MNPYIQLFLGCFSLSLVVLYVIWSKFRVWVLRQDLFAVRDDLWEQIRTDGTLDHPAHREFRDALNSLIRIAPYLSLFTFAKILADHRGPFALLLTHQSELPAVVVARKKAFRQVARYLLFYSISGVTLVLFLTVAVSVNSLIEAVAERVQWLVDSRTVESIARGVPVDGDLRAT